MKACNKLLRIHRHSIVHRHTQLIDLRLCDVDDRLFRVRGKAFLVEYREVVAQTAADGEEEVAVLQCIVPIARGDASNIAEIVTVIAAMKGALHALRGEHGHPKLRCERTEIIQSIREKDTVADENSGAFGACKPLRNARNHVILLVICRTRVHRRRCIALKRGRIDLRRLHIEWEIDPRRTRSAMRGEVNRLFDFIANACGVFHRHSVFCNALHDGENADFLCARLTHPRKCRHIGGLDLS